MSKKSKNRFDVVPAKAATTEKTMLQDIAELKERVSTLEQGTGIKGDKGEKGDPGAQGKQGETGHGILGF